jgi:diguanylate cyclase
LPTADAFAQANHLRDVMLLALAILAAAGVAAAGAVAMVVARRNSQLVDSVEQLHALATRDALTGLANRGEASRLLAQHLALAVRGDLEGVGLVFLDIDRFKALNDGTGHVGADRVLCAIAASMSEQLRPGDLLARFGGDEFVVIAPGVTSPSAAQALAERLRAAVASTEVTNESTGDLVGQVTVSVGAAVSGPASTVDSLLQEADQAMYLAKRAGGNLVMMAFDPLPV